MKTGWKIAFAILGTLFSIGLIKYLMARPRGEAVVLRVPPTPIPIRVHVSGGVMTAGIYSLPAGSRVMEAVEAAGGFSTDANPDALNLAAYLEDGELIQIPVLQATPEMSKSFELDLQRTPEIENYVSLIDLNTATQQELETLPGIGPVLAHEIIAYRESKGNFENIEEILEVKGIGNARFEQIRDLITVGE